MWRATSPTRRLHSGHRLAAATWPGTAVDFGTSSLRCLSSECSFCQWYSMLSTCAPHLGQIWCCRGVADAASFGNPLSRRYRRWSSTDPVGGRCEWSSAPFLRTKSFRFCLSWSSRLVITESLHIKTQRIRLATAVRETDSGSGGGWLCLPVELVRKRDGCARTLAWHQESRWLEPGSSSGLSR
jgi:hypothetical protein